MTWVVDTCIVIDVLDDDPDFGQVSAALLDRLAPEGLDLCPVSYVELGPAFLGDPRRQDDFLANIGIHHRVAWDWGDTQSAHKAWDRYVHLRRSKKTVRRRPIADILIGAFAGGRGGLLTRNPDDFKDVFPALKIVTP